MEQKSFKEQVTNGDKTRSEMHERAKKTTREQGKSTYRWGRAEVKSSEVQFGEMKAENGKKLIKIAFEKSSKVWKINHSKKAKKLKIRLRKRVQHTFRCQGRRCHFLFASISFRNNWDIEFKSWEKDKQMDRSPREAKHEWTPGSQRAESEAAERSPVIGCSLLQAAGCCLSLSHSLWLYRALLHTHADDTRSRRYLPLYISRALARALLPDAEEQILWKFAE